MRSCRPTNSVKALKARPKALKATEIEIVTANIKKIYINAMLSQTGVVSFFHYS